MSMITSSDFLTINYTPDLTEAGIAYACRSLPHTYDRMGGSYFKRLRRIVAGIAVELAFRRYLSERKIPHDNMGSTPFTDPDRYDIAIGGRRCDIKSFMLTQKNRIRQVRQEPHVLLSAQALVPVDQMASDNLTNDDIYIFAFLSALLTPNLDALNKAIEANQPVFLIRVLPKTWSRPERWLSLGKLALKCDTSTSTKIELGGQNENHDFQTEKIALKPRKRVQLKNNFYSLGHLRTPSIPDGTVGVHSPVLDETFLVEPKDWGNIWVYGMQIIFTGYITRGNFLQTAIRIPAGSRVFQYSKTRTDNLALPISNLYPLRDLFERVQAWGNKT
jgi:hypothetical protein